MLADGKASVQAGAGIVYDSVPETEYQETVNKARAVFTAVAQAQGRALHASAAGPFATAETAVFAFGRRYTVRRELGRGGFGVVVHQEIQPLKAREVYRIMPERRPVSAEDRVLPEGRHSARVHDAELRQDEL